MFAIAPILTQSRIIIDFQFLVDKIDKFPESQETLNQNFSLYFENRFKVSGYTLIWPIKAIVSSFFCFF